MTPDPTDPEAAPPLKKKRGAPDPDVEVIALSPGTLQAATRFACEACGKEFPREQNLRLHHRSHNLPWRPRPEAAPQRRRKVYVCPEPGCVHHSLECAFGDLATIKKHFCRKHGEKRWACKRCGKRYAVELDLKAHAKANTCGTREHTRFTRRSVPVPQSPDLEAQENVDKDKEKGEEETEQPPSGEEEEVTEKVPSPPTLPQEPSTPCALQATGEKGGGGDGAATKRQGGGSDREGSISTYIATGTIHDIKRSGSFSFINGCSYLESNTGALQATGASRGARGSMEERRKPYLVSVPRRRSRRSIISSTLISHPSAPASVSGSPATSAQQPASMASTGIVAPVVTDLVDFLNASPTSFHAVDEAKRRLKVAGYAQLSERREWTGLELGRKYFFTHNHSTIFAFAIGVKYVAGNGFHIIGAHIDSPCLKLKPVSKVTKGGNLEVGVQTYGSGLWYTWFDCDLTVAGMVIVKEKKEGSISYAHKLVRVQEPIMRIPTFAVHLDRTISSEGLKINNQSHLVPVLTTCIKNEIKKLVGENGPEESSENKNMKHHPLLLQLIAKEANCEPDDISDFELQVCDTQPSIVAGAMKEFIFSGRLDNLCMSFCSLKALIDSDHSLDHESGVRMVALFDHEEVGSNSAQGAGSPAMLDALSRITASFNTSNSKLLEKAIQRSFLVSADMAHALHPNYMDKHEENHQPKMHGGLVIKDNANQRYATNAFIFREFAERHQLPVQDLVARNDTDFGSTIGLKLASGIGIRTVDIGAPLLSMHSIREMCAVDDINHLYEHFKAYFEEFTELDSKAKVDDC